MNLQHKHERAALHTNQLGSNTDNSCDSDVMFVKGSIKKGGCGLKKTFKSNFIYTANAAAQGEQGSIDIGQNIQIR